MMLCLGIEISGGSWSLSSFGCGAASGAGFSNCVHPLHHGYGAAPENGFNFDDLLTKKNFVKTLAGIFGGFSCA
jgi:hypothetical protein